MNNQLFFGENFSFDSIKRKKQNNILKSFSEFNIIKAAADNIKQKKEDEKKKDPFYHHRMMAGYHAAMEQETNDNFINLNVSSNKNLLGEAKKSKGESKRHGEMKMAHIEKAKSLHDVNKHGAWEKTIPSRKEAMGYGKNHGEELDKGSEAKEKMYKSDLQESLDIIKGDLLYELNSPNITFDKTGSELKELSISKLNQLNNRIELLQTKREIITNKLNELQIPIINNYADPYSVQSDDVNKICREYNDIWGDIKSTQDDIKFLQTFVENLVDDKVYTLSLRQLNSINN